MPTSSFYLFCFYSHLLLFTGPHQPIVAIITISTHQTIILAHLCLIVLLNASAKAVKYSPVEWYSSIFKSSSRFCALPKYLKDNKHNRFHLTLKYARYNCPWKFSVPIFTEWRLLFKKLALPNKEWLIDWINFSLRLQRSITFISLSADRQNTGPQSMDYHNGLPKWTTLKWTTAKNNISNEYHLKL